MKFVAGFITTYEKEFIDRNFTRVNLFELLKQEYGGNKALYLGSHIHVAPSLIYPYTVYVDSYKRAAKLFDDPGMDKYVETNKQYKNKSTVRFLHTDYSKSLDIDVDFDLLISQYAGFVSQSGKRYLKGEGIIVANNSHGDASMANLDDDYEFIAVANHTNDKWRLSSKGLAEYFVPKNGKPDNRESLTKSMRGTGYTKTAANYIFKKR